MIWQFVLHCHSPSETGLLPSSHMAYLILTNTFNHYSVTSYVQVNDEYLLVFLKESTKLALERIHHGWQCFICVKLPSNRKSSETSYHVKSEPETNGDRQQLLFAQCLRTNWLRGQPSINEIRGGGGALRYRGGRTRVTYFAEEGVFF